jgi:hypothetical protein
MVPATTEQVKFIELDEPVALNAVVGAGDLARVAHAGNVAKVK